MSGEVDSFAKNAITQLGMSETTAKRMASTFMAMSNGMNIASDAGKTMAISLTQLAGDMASFYNVEQSVAETALKSVFTGETETLKKFGIVLTETNLKEYALSQGITKQYSAMSQAEKVALRYNYVLQATGQVQGDFARTSGNWANQVRVLKEQWGQLLSILGKGLIAVLTPLLQALNKLLSMLIAVGNAIAKIFGGKGMEANSSAIGGMADSAGGFADNMESGSESLSDANKKAKELERTLMGFDEINTLSPQNDDSGAGVGSGGISGGGFDVGSLISDTEEASDTALSRIEQFVAKAKEIIDKWIKTIPKLEFNFDKEKALKDLEGIGLDIVNVIAGWTSFVITIGIKVANDLDVGRILNDIISLVKSVTGLASSVTDILVPALEKLYDSASPVIKLVGDAVHTVFDVVKGWIDQITKTLKDHTPALEKVFDNISEIVSVLSKFISDICGPIIEWLGDVGDWLGEWILGDTLGYLIEALADISDIIKGIFDLFTNNPLQGIQNILNGLINTVLDTGAYVLDIIIDIGQALGKDTSQLEALKQKMLACKDPIQIVTKETKDQNKELTNQDTALSNLMKAQDDEKGKMSELSSESQKLKNQVSQTTNSYKTDMNSVKNNVKENSTQIQNEMKKIDSTNSNTGNSFSNMVTNVSNGLRSVYNTVASWVSSICDKIREVWNSITNAENSADKSVTKASTKPTKNITVTVDNSLKSSNRLTGIQQYASGGLIDQGQLFVARESGPELVGSIGKTTAVANNNQIIDGIKQGVKEALLEAGSNNNGGDINLYLDSTIVAKKVIKYHNDLVKQTGLSPLMV